MKTKIQLFGIITIFVMLLTGQLHAAANGAFEKAMAEQLKSLHSSSNSSEYLNHANSFERIAKAEKTKWEAWYYAAYAQLMSAAMNEDVTEKDAQIDKALEHIEAGIALKEFEEEFLILKGWGYSMKISVDPAARGQQYSQMAQTELVKVLTMTPQNPRGLHMMAQLQYGTAQFFGSDTGESCKLNEKAAEAVEGEEMKSTFWPQWGKYAIESFRQQCSQ